MVIKNAYNCLTKPNSLKLFKYTLIVNPNFGMHSNELLSYMRIDDNNNILFRRNMNAKKRLDTLCARIIIIYYVWYLTVFRCLLPTSTHLTTYYSIQKCV